MESELNGMGCFGIGIFGDNGIKAFGKPRVLSKEDSGSDVLEFTKPLTSTITRQNSEVHTLMS